MQPVFRALQEWMAQHVQFVKVEEEDAGEIYDILEEDTGEVVGQCILTASNRLSNFSYFCEEKNGELTSNDMPAIAEAFITQFYPLGLQTYQLQSIIDINDLFIVSYGAKEERYGIDVPGIGFSLSISPTGQVIQFSYTHEQAEIRYPSHIITPEEAKEKYASYIDFDLIVQLLDTELYANGDNTYRLLYGLKEYAIDIPASGVEPAVVSVGGQVEPIEMRVPPTKSLHEWIGVTRHHRKIGEQSEEDVLIEKFMHPSIDLPNELDMSEVYEENLITIHTHRVTNLPKVFYNGEPWKGEPIRLTTDFLKQRALDFLFAIFPQASEHFVMQKEEVANALETPLEAFIDDEYEDDFEEWEDELLNEEEETVPFYFQYQVNGVPVDESVTCILVGVLSGRIVSASIEPMEEESLLQICTEPKLSKAAAKKLLLEKLHMEIALAQAYDEDGEPFYEVVYLPSYTETTGHIRAIDAQNGKAYYVNVGDSLFL
ncbi:hypothetical protein QT711_09705 [Sporosarcina saromensis]|uniref:YcdB/YcdC repeated domain-containing protein n=2 Tax=Sporosarcina saromensis TaxID=359365 RepID=A0ABU4G922_9BACL|nr:hypothetical protein [Sporosarcina saromensis]